MMYEVDIQKKRIRITMTDPNINLVRLDEQDYELTQAILVIIHKKSFTQKCASQILIVTAAPG
jgi:hypothetical protein